MTRDEILAMEPGRELDVLVAEEVMGFDVVEDPESAICGGSRVSGGLWVIIERDYHEWGHNVVPPEPYSTTWRSMGQVVEKMLSLEAFECYLQSQTYGWYCSFQHPGNRGGQANGDCAETPMQAPEAICKAALLAVMEAG